MEAPYPNLPPLPYPSLRNVFSPRQVHFASGRRIEHHQSGDDVKENYTAQPLNCMLQTSPGLDVPFVPFDISNPATALPETNRLRLIRARKIAPVHLGEGQIPVAPLENPLYGISHHRIRLSNPVDISRVVELFVRDNDLYFAGFRRGVVAAMGVEPQWGTLFIFDDLYNEAPPFFGAVKMGMNSDHTNKGDAPGPEAVLGLFETLFSFQDNVAIGVDGEGNPQVKGMTGNVREALQNAVARVIIIFCEALRLKSIYTLVIEAFESFEFARRLPKRCWKLIRWWGQLCDDVQTLRRNHKRALDTDLPRRQNFTVVGLGTLGQLIGENGELTFCKVEKMVIITDKVMSKLKNEVAAVNFVDPMFQEEEVEGGGERGGKKKRKKKRERSSAKVLQR